MGKSIVAKKTVTNFQRVTIKRFARASSVVSVGFASDCLVIEMILRVWLTVLVSFVFLSRCYCLSDAAEDDKYIDSLATVELPNTGLYEDKDRPEPTRSRRLKRSSWSLPPNTSSRIVFDAIMPIAPLNNTFSALTLNLGFRFVLPTYSQLVNLYSSLGRLDDENNELIHEDEQSNSIDLDFFEEQRANRDRRAIYQHTEGIFER